MGTSNTVERMATYDFKAPIDVVYFEENSDEVVDLTSSPKSKDTESNNIVLETDLTSTENENTCSKNIEQTEDEKRRNATKRKSVIEIRESNDNENNKDRVTTIDPPKKLKTPKKLNTIDKASDSLKSISKYLTLILESLYQYSADASNKNSTPTQLTLLKETYLTIKFHFFKAAYEHVNNHLLPNENNQAFIHNFLNYTIIMANNRIKRDCTTGITEIYFEMLKWVKQRKLKDFYDSCKTPILRKHLSDPTVVPDITISETIKTVSQICPSEADQTRLCVFASGPPGREININVEKSLISSNNQILTSKPQNKIIQQNLNTQQYLHNRLPPDDNLSVRHVNKENNYGNRQMYGELMTQQNNLMQPMIPSNGYLPTADNRVPHYPPTSNCSRNVVNENNQITPNASYNYYHTRNNFQNNSFYSAHNFIHHGPPNNIIHADESVGAYRRDYPRPEAHVQPPPYRSPVAVQPIQMMQPVTPAPPVLPGLPSEPDLTRSSVSTDSGFVSPVGTKSSTNSTQDIMNDLFELTNTFEPSRAATLTQTVCNVCHKHATLMCSACFKTTYCNTKCQRLDWETHKLSCLPPTGRRQ